MIALRRPVAPDEQPLFYRLPAELLAAQMSTADGYDVIAVRREGEAVVYVVAVDITDGGCDVEEVRRATVGELVHLAVWPDTAAEGDGSRLSGAVDVRTR